MKSNTVERVTDWDSEPFTDGYDGLRELADREFTGAATDGSAWLFMLNGRVLGCFDGDIESFADADGTVYKGPDPALPLLFAMQETGGETRAEYYSEETPLSEVNQTLESGNFTGYVELSENVLSGDYYVAYYGGRSLPVAFVGNQSERLTGDEAFERADDEVGIYTVNTVSLDITDIPGDEDESTTAGGISATEPEESTTAGGIPAAESADSDDSPTESSEAESAVTATEPDDARQAEEATDADTVEDTADAPAEEHQRSAETAEEPAAEPETESDADAAEKAEPTAQRQSAGGQSETEEQREQSARTTRQSEPQPADARTTEEERWRGAKTIPALNPEESVDMAEEVPGGVDTSAAATTATQPKRRAADGTEIDELKAERDRLQERVEELAAANEELASKAEEVADERDQLERERDEAQAKMAELETQIDELEATIDRLEGDLSDAEAELTEVEQYIPEGDHDIAVDRALEGTNLFVRYERQGGATLEDAHDGKAGRPDVNENLRLEHHTDFEDDGAIVDGQPFQEWLTGTMAYGFGRWLVEEFIHDIRETGNQSSLSKLYDTIPEVDRIEFQGTVELPVEDEEEAPETATFDVVLRDRMGNPLIVADLNDSREAATESMLGTLIENATPVAKARESLASAFFVTTSYYDPAALETAEEATGGGFLSRDKSKSFVKLSRKGGYHLCLVETRDGEFHVSVPEL